MVTPERFRRSEVQFFRDRATIDALSAIAGAARIVIYCGAGVTIDRTGLGWSELIASVFQPDEFSTPDYPTSAEIESMRLTEDPMRLASVLTQYGLDQDETKKKLQRRLTPLLQNRLYKNNAWQAGRLSNGIASLAIGAASLGIKVDVVTTNYDTHLESSFRAEIKRFKSELDGEGISNFPMIGGVDVLIGNKSKIVHQINPSNGPQRIRLRYLHGRVHENGSAEGRLVLSEDDYVKTRLDTFEVLSNLFGKRDSALMIFGSSLTDPPLIEALISTRRSVSRAEFRRYAFISRSSFGYLDGPASFSNRIVDHFGRRAELLGVDLLTPDFRFQTAQFCEELQHLISDPSVSYGSADGLGKAAYGARLDSWWAQWSVSERATDPDLIFELLTTDFIGIKKYIDDSTPRRAGVKPTPESFRLELWLRDDPTLNGRQLALWADSIGPIKDRSSLRKVLLDVGSLNASVRCFCEGRPQHVDQTELTDRATSVAKDGRWQSYLSVPIYVSVEEVRIPVGVMTLASTLPIAESRLPLPKIDLMEELKNMIIRVGRRLLAIEYPVEQSFD